MRIAFLTHEPFHPPSGGGSAEAVYLVREMVRRGHDVHVFCPEFPEAVTVAQRFGFTAHRFTTWQMGRYTAFRNFKYLLYPTFLARMVARAAATTSFDVVFSQHAISAAAAGQLKPRLGVPVVMNFLDYLTAFMETWPPYLAPPPLLRRLMRYELGLPRKYGADAVLTVSDTLADLFADSGYPRARLHPIYYGYDAALFQPAHAPAAGAPIVIMHGSFDRHHLGPIALDAIRRVHAARPDVRFRFVGRETPALRSVRTRLQAAWPQLPLECTGFVPYAEVGRDVARATVGLVPYEESTGVHCAFVAKTVEYLGSGIPVASTPLRSAQRYFGNEPAVRFSRFEGGSLGDTVLSWLSEPAEQRRQLGQAAATRVAAELDWSRISQRALEFTEAAVARV